MLFEIVLRAKNYGREHVEDVYSCRKPLKGRDRPVGETFYFWQDGGGIVYLQSQNVEVW